MFNLVNIAYETISIIKNDVVVYSDSIANFELDSGIVLEKPESPWIGKVYYANTFMVRFYNAHTESTYLDEWQQGDFILENSDLWVAAKIIRVAQNAIIE